MRQAFCFLFLFSTLLFTACGDDDGGTCSPGLEGCPCAEGGLCLAGLSCFSNICVNPSGDAGTPDGGGGVDVGPGGDAGPTGDGGALVDVGGPNPDAFFADDPPPMECREDGTRGTPAVLPGGTPECPDDKNREGCFCDVPGETAECWPGQRVHRNRGICRDGRTTCMPVGDLGGRWGPCTGYVLPAEDATLGPQACRCFSMGRWDLQNLSPCFISYNGGAQVYAVSTTVAGSTAQCPDVPNTPPPPAPALPWSENSLTVDCEGRFELCYTLKAGDADTPSAADCTVTTICTEGWYAERDVAQAFPDLGGWTSTDPTCARQFRDSGGYGEMSVRGLSVECDEISEAGEPYVFNRVNYCPLSCNETPDAPECEGCMMGGSGSF